MRNGGLMTMAGCAVGVLILTACGQTAPDAGTAAPGSGAADGLPACETAEVLRAPEGDYRDEPVYVGNDQPVEHVQAWALDLPGFAGVWIDRERNGWVTVAFTEDVDQRRAEAAEQFSDEGVAVVAAEHTEAELTALADRIHTETPEGVLLSSGVAIDRGVVSVEVRALTEENLTALEPFATEPICVSGRHPADIVPAGDQPTEGEGWRLLGDERTGEVYRTGVATTPAQYEQLWARAGMTGERPQVDFTDEIVVWFGAVYGSSCPIRLDGVAVTEGVLHGQIVIPGSPGACTEDANPHSYLVAVERAMLPADPFHVQLSADDPPRGSPEERTVVSVDLREPGSTATDDQIGTDADLIDTADEPQPVQPGGVIEPGFPWPYRLELGTACGISRLGPLNGVTWVSDTRDLPDAWEAAREGETVVVEVLLTERTSDGGPSLTATVGAGEVSYRPLRSSDPAC